MRRWFLFGALLGLAFPLLGQTTTSDLGHRIAAALQSGQVEEAKRLLAGALQTSPRDARLWTLNGLALVQSGEEPAALASFDRALALAPTYFPALEGAAEIEFHERDPRAAALLKQIVRLRPAEPAAHGMLAQLAFERGDCATAAAEVAAAQPPEIAPLASERERGACLIRENRIGEALPIFKRLLDRQPSDLSARDDLAAARFLAGDYRGVIATLTPVLNNGTADADTLDLLAEAYGSLSDTTQALPLLERAIHESPATAKYYADFAYLCLASHQFEAGLAAANLGIQNVPDAPSLYAARGVLYSELAQYDKGEQDFDRAEQLDRNFGIGSTGRSLAELQRNDLPRAEATVRGRLRTEPKDPFMQYLLAAILLRKGVTPPTLEFKEALAAAQTAVSLQPGLILARNMLGELLMQEGQTDAAIEQFRAVLQINPDDEKALYHLVLALKKANRPSEVPGLMKHLVAVRQQNRRQEDLNVTASPPQGTAAAPPPPGAPPK